MKPSDIFGIVVRTVGLVMALVALSSFIRAIVQPALLLYEIPALLLGLWLLRGGKAVVSFAFPEEREDDGLMDRSPL